MAVVRMMSFFPKLDKTDEVQAILETSAKATPGQSLAVNIFGEIPVFVTTKVFDSLEEIEKNRTDSSRAAHRAALNGLLRQPINIRLLSPIVPPTQPIGGPEQRYQQQVVLFPTTQGQDALRGILEEFAKEQQANGRPCFRMAELLHGADGPAFSMGDSFESIAELESVNQQRSTGVRSALRAKIAAHVARTTIVRIRAVIVPADN